MIPLHNGLLLEHEYTVVEVTGVPADIYNWLTDKFGPAGTRWFYHGHKIYFRDERDWMWFELAT
jgi:hypothetical protein